MASPCPCCGYLVFPEPASGEICPICGWQDDVSQLRFPRETGANRVSLLEGQRNFLEFGTSDRRKVDRVRVVTSAGERDPEWRPLDEARDEIEEPVSGVDYGASYPQDYARLYYWRARA
jgi:hypothetical protein